LRGTILSLSTPSRIDSFWESGFLPLFQSRNESVSFFRVNIGEASERRLYLLEI